MRWLLLIVSVGGILLWLELARRKREFWGEGNYMRQIAILKPREDEAVPLPPIKPLKASRAIPWHQLKRRAGK